MNLKFTFFTLMFLLALQDVHAKVIPVCEKLGEKVTKIDEDFSELINKAEKYTHRKKHCHAARMFQLSLLKNQEEALNNRIEIKMLEALKKGGYLNDFMNFNIALKKLKGADYESEYIQYMLAEVYEANLPDESDFSKVGNFVNTDGTPMGLVKESKIIHKRFLDKFKNSQYSTEVEKGLKKTEEVALAQAISTFEEDYKSLKRNTDKELLLYYSSNLAKAILENNSQEQRIEALYSLFNYYKNNRDLENADANIVTISRLLETSYPHKKYSGKVKNFITKNNISSGDAVSIEELAAKIVKASPIEKELLSNEDLKELIKRKKGNDQSIFMPLSVTTSEATIMLTSLGVVGIMMAFDRPLMDFVQDNKSERLSEIIEITNLFGEMAGLAPIIGGSMALGLVFKNDQLKRAAIRSVGAALISQLVVETLKALTHRARPRDNQGPYHFEGPDWTSDNTSFPSGHSAGAWAVMTVFATEFEDTKIVPILAYSLAALTSFSRVYKNAHWFSDVTLAALIGWASGKLMYKLFRKKESKGNISVAPVMGEMTGASVTVRTKGQQELQAWPLDYYNFITGHTLGKSDK
jgi:membrane-associated phospholipid phosphatase